MSGKFTSYKSLFIFTLMVMMNLNLHAQIRNALAFDGIDDRVTVPLASALIANSNQMSITCWVNPDSLNVPFPDFDGFCGFRNDGTADFYLIHIYVGQLEGRFRSSSGTPYTVTINGVQPHVWQHFALTYDGSWLRIYANGYIADSVSATGTITSGSQPFNIGYLPYTGGSNFYTQGMVDEVTLWNKALSDSEVACVMQYGPKLSDPALKLTFDCNQGVPGGNNSGIATLKDQSNHIDGNFVNMPLTGTTSNFVLGPNAGHTSFVAELCQGDTYFFDGTTLSTAGFYVATAPGANGCDSIATLDLSYTTLNMGVLHNGNLLASLETNATYQWVDCTNGFNPIIGEVNQAFTATTSGSFAVILTSGNCTDTSACTPVIVSVAENTKNVNLHVFPNPANDHLSMSFDKNMEIVKVTIFSLEGKTLLEDQFLNRKDCKIDVAELATGTYLLKVVTENGSAVKVFQKSE